MLREDILEFLDTIPKEVCVVAATKYVGSSDMIELYHSGVSNFGENRVDSFLKKYEELKEYQVHWHFIGHLQRNKAHDVLPKIEYLHSLDSIDLAKIIEKERNEPLKCFVEVSINLEENKNGVPYNEINTFMKEVLSYSKVQVVGFMMMSKAGSTKEEYLKQFKALDYLRHRVEQEFDITLPYLSMGMSEDYKEAITAHATHIRLGRILWKN